MTTLNPQNDDYHALLQSATEAVFLLSDRVEDCNEQACQLLGYHRIAIIGRTLADFSPPRQLDGSLSQLTAQQRMAAAGKGLRQTFAWQCLCSDGTGIDTLVSLEAIRVNHQEWLLCRMRDVTHLNRAEYALRESQSHLQQILDNTTAIVYIKDAKGRLRFVNRHFERLFNVREAEVLGKCDDDIFPKEMAEQYRRNDQLVLTRQASIEFEETALLQDGTHTFLSIKFPLFDFLGKDTVVCGIATDITKRKRTEEALRNIALGVTGARGDDIFRELVRYLAVTLGVEVAFIGLLDKDCSIERITTLAVYDSGHIVENLQYDLSGTPCENVVGRQYRFFATGVRALFPQDVMLCEGDFDSYAAYPLFDSRSKALGLIAVMDRKPLVDRELTESMLKIFSVRAAAELERMYSDEARRLSEASYRAIFEASEDAIFIHDFATGAIIDVNPKACIAYGYSREELQHCDVGVISSGEYPYTLEEASKLIAKAREGQPLRFPWHRKNQDGTLLWDEVVLKRAVIGGQQRILAFSREITERKLAEDALRASEEQYRAIFTASVDGLALFSADGQLVDCNPAFERMHGYPREELLTIAPLQFIHPDSHRIYREFLDSVNTGLPFHSEAQSLRKDGLVVDVEVRGVQMHYQGKPHVLAMVRDISKRKQAERERVRLEGQLRQAQKMEAIGHLTGGIAHDFNNILSSIMGHIVLAMERQAQFGDDKLNRYLERANRSAQRARDLIQQMLTFSRGQRREPKSLSLPPLIKESSKLLSATLPSSIEMHTELVDELPKVMLDPIQIEQVLMNLCINARDAMAGCGSIIIRLRHLTRLDTVCTACRQPVTGDFVELAVRDTGPGIALEILERMFEPFFSTKPKGRGSGMGLATVHGIVHEHRGHIVVDTTPGEGAEFRVLFRAAGPVSSEKAQPEIVEPASSQPHRGLTGNVLVVDDEESVGEFMKELLESWGLKVTLKTCSLEAQTAFVSHPQQFDLVVTDQIMPRMTGLILAQRFLNIRPNLPVILYTGYSDSLTEQQFRESGIREVLRKPVDFNELFTAVKNALSGLR